MAICKACSSVSRAAGLIKKSDSGQPIRQGFFDRYVQNLAASDHLLKGMRGLLNDVCFLQLSPIREQHHLYAALCKAMKQMGQTYQSSLFHCCVNSLNNLSMNSIYAILSTLSSILQDIQVCTALNVFPLAHLLAKLIGLTLWRQSTDNDGMGAVKYIHNQDEEKYYSEMFSMASRLLDRSAELCALYIFISRALNKPNIYPLFE